MSTYVKFTCVPMGKSKTDAAKMSLDVLVTPQCSVQSQLDTLAGWTAALKQLGEPFHLKFENGVQVDLGLDKQWLQPTLWKTLLGDALLNSGAGGASVPNPIGPNGLSLSMTHDLAHDFYRKSAFSRAIQPDQHGPDTAFLAGLHKEAITTHGYIDGPAAPGADLMAQQQAERSVVNMLAQVVANDQSLLADTLISKRFGFQVTAAAGVRLLSAHGVRTRTPANAMKAFAKLRNDLTNNLLKASGKALSPDIPGPNHLLYHVNYTLTSAKGRNAAGVNAVAQSALGRPPVTFNQRITLLLNMPAIMEALGLVLHFTLPIEKMPACGATGQMVSLSLPDSLTALLGNGGPQLPVTVANCSFYPQALTGSSVFQSDGWFNPKDGYRAGSLQLDSAANQITKFANEVGMRQAVHVDQLNRGVPPISVFTTSMDEDVDHPIIPPSPHTGGLQVWQDKRQDRVDAARQRAQTPTLGDATNPLYAEDLTSGTVVNVLATNPNDKRSKAKWVPLCSRHETYTFDGVRIERRDCERGVKTASTRPIDTGIDAKLSHQVDETIFNWRLGSLVTKPKIKVEHQKRESVISNQALPWQGVSAVPPVLEQTEDIPSPLFGWVYQPTLRPSFVTGGTLPFESDFALRALQIATTFLRYELILGPDLVWGPSGSLLGEHKTVMMIGSNVSPSMDVRLASWNSKRILVPPAVHREVALRHGKPEALLDQGTDMFEAIRAELNADKLDAYADKNAPKVPFLPDPLCSGVVATLTDLSGKVLGRSELDFHGGDDTWPDFTPHVLKLRRPEDMLHKGQLIEIENLNTNEDRDDFYTDSSKALVCALAPGSTCILSLRPKLDPAVLSTHALSGVTSLGVNPDLSLLALSDICRPTVVRLIHATDRPVKKPGVVLDPNYDGDPRKPLNLGADVEPLSTSKVAFKASWQEVTDDLQMPGPTSLMMNAQLSELDIKKKLTIDGKGYGRLIPQKAVWPFSDAKHRRLNITAEGTARYGDALGKSGSNNLRLTGDSISIDVLATSAPAAPDVEYILPNLKWNLQGKQRTRTMGLTVVLNRPWFGSGAGERLAVLTSQVTDPQASEVSSIGGSFIQKNLEDAVTAYGVMPDWTFGVSAKSAVPRLKIATEVPVTEDPKAPPVSGIVQVKNASYNALFFTPQYNELDQQWFVNLTFERPPVYGAVVRLVLARYQHYALSGMQLSPVQACDFSLLGAERCLSVKKSFWNPHKTITITGVGAYTQASPPQLVTEFDVRHIELGKMGEGDFGWTEGEAIPADHGFTPKGQILWQGTLKSYVPGNKVIVRERETYPLAEDPGKNTARWVYLDAVQL